jgi:hypothetical protein
MSRCSARVALVAAVLVAAGASARGEIYGSTFRSPVYGVEMTVPRGWEISEQSSYPGILARAYEHTSHSRLTLAVQMLAPGDNLKAYLDRNVQSLKRLKYDVAPPASRGGVLVVQSRTPDKKQVVRQAYIARASAVFILTIATDETGGANVRQFEDTLRSLTFAAAPAAPASAPAAPTDGAPGGTAGDAPTPSPNP